MNQTKINANPNLVVENLLQQVAELSQKCAIATAIVDEQANEIEQLKAQLEGGADDEN